MTLKSVLFVVLSSCVGSGSTSFEEVVASAIVSEVEHEAPDAGSEDPVQDIEGTFIVIPGHDISFMRPGDEWKVTAERMRDPATEGMATLVGIEHPASGAGLSIIAAHADPSKMEDVVLHTLVTLSAVCDDEPSFSLLSGYDEISVRMECLDMDMTAPQTSIIVRASVFIRKALPRTIIVVMGVWQIQYDEIAVPAIEKIESTLSPVVEL